MKLAVRILTLVLLIALTISDCQASEAANPTPPPSLKELANSYKHVFLGTVENTTVGAAHTYYTLNITEWIKGNCQTNSLIWITEGGSEIAVSPSTTLYTNTEYIVFLDSHNSSHIKGTHTFKLQNRYTDNELDRLRFDHNSPSSIKAREAVRRAAAEKAASSNVVAVTALKDPPSETIPEQDHYDGFAPYFLVVCLVSLVLLDRLPSG